MVDRTGILSCLPQTVAHVACGVTPLSGRLDAGVARNLLGTCRAGARRSQAGEINRAPTSNGGTLPSEGVHTVLTVGNSQR